MRRQLRKRFELATATSGWEGLDLLSSQGPFSLVISDMRMPGIDGIEFLAKVKTHAPDTVRVMLTGNADLDTAINAVNDGQIFRFLTKPCSPELMIRTIDAALLQYRMITAERELLESTLGNTIKVLIEILSLVNPSAFGRTQRIERYVIHMVKALNLTHIWQFELAALLSQIGSVVLPSDTISKFYSGIPLNPGELKMWEEHPRIGAKLIENIPRLKSVANMVAAQQYDLDVPDDFMEWETSDIVDLGGHLLKVATEFDAQLMLGESVASTVNILKKRDGFNKRIVETLSTLDIRPEGEVVRSLSVSELDTTMVLYEDVITEDGVILATKDQEVTYPLLQRLRSASMNLSIGEPILVAINRLIAT